MFISILVGILIGLVLGLTGAGGSIIALPLLILLLNLNPQEAVTVALCAVAASSLFGTLSRLRSDDIVWLPAMMFAIIGSAFTPLGTFLNRLIPESAVLLGFLFVVAIVARRMWRQANLKPEELNISRAQFNSETSETNDPYCRMNQKQSFQFGPRCFVGMLGGASLTGILSGLFGVGGGFIIVPTLMFLTGISIQQAVATSLVIISAVSSSAILTHFFQGTLVTGDLLYLVSAGGLIGMLLGGLIAKKINGAKLQKIFSATIIFLSFLIILKQFGYLPSA